jgi:WD40 repeat protein
VFPNPEQDAAAIATEFVPWCRKHFLQPLLTTQPPKQSKELLVSRPPDIYAVDFLDQHCKLLYNHKVKRHTPRAWTEPQTMNETLMLKDLNYPVHCKFHPYDDVLFAADKDSFVHVYDVQSNRTSMNTARLSFSVPGSASRKSIITAFQLINAQHEPMIVTGTDDRVVRVFKPDLTYYRYIKTNCLYS